MRISVSRFLAAIVAVCMLVTMPLSSADASCLPGELQSKLSQISSTFGSIKVISTHRPGATIAGSGKPSYHRWCRAVDFIPPSGKYSAVVAWLHSNHSGGVGTYSSGHIHLDNGPYVRFSHGGGGFSKSARASRTASSSDSGSWRASRSSLGRGTGKGSSGKSSGAADTSWMSRIAGSQ